MIRSAVITNIGQRRKMNQDSFFVSNEAIGNLTDLYIVADGMGGHKAGDFASRYVAEHVSNGVRDSFEQNPTKILDRVIHSVNRELRTIAASSDEYYGMGTTCVAATITGDFLQVANVGDSRLYVYSSDVSEEKKEGVLKQITTDHSLVEEMVLAGGLDNRKARSHPNKNIITRAIGAEDRVEIDFFTEQLKKNDLILMCTDGLTNMVEDSRIAEILSLHESLDAKARMLVGEANHNGGKDNITVILIDPFSEVI